MPRKTRGHASAETVLSARTLRSALTSAEEILWQALRGSRLDGLKFRRQHPLGHFVLDFFCVERQLDVEVDGGIHNTSAQAEYDVDRTRYLNEHGVHVLRVTNDEVINNLDLVLAKIRNAASPTPQSPPSPDVLPSGEGGQGE